MERLEFSSGPVVAIIGAGYVGEYFSDDSALFTLISDRFGGILTAIHLKEKLNFNNFIVRLLAQVVNLC